MRQEKREDVLKLSELVETAALELSRHLELLDSQLKGANIIAVRAAFRRGRQSGDPEDVA